MGVRMGAGGAGWTVWRLAAGSSLLPLLSLFPLLLTVHPKNRPVKKGPDVRCVVDEVVYFLQVLQGRADELH